MRTEARTVGFGGGFTNAKTTAAERGAAAVVPVRRREVARAARKEDARPVLQHRTGASNGFRQMTDDSLAHLPRWKRWGLYAFAATCMTGIVPIAAASALIAATDAAGAQLESLIGSGGVLAIGIVACLAGIVACMVYMLRPVSK